MGLSFDLDAEVVRLIRAKVIELPTYPGVALQLQRVISSQNYGVDDLVKLVEADPALASHVLRAANSAFYRAAQPITTLPAAILRIGASELGHIALAGTLGVQASMDGPLLALRRDAWRRSLVGGLVCQHLAKARAIDPAEAFLAGLLHDFGETIAYRTFEVILSEHPDTQPQPSSDWEARGRAYHVELGMALAVDWKLPEFLCDVVARHHDDDTSHCEQPNLMALVAFADVVCARLFEAPSLEGADLASIAGLQPADRVTLTALVPKLPALLQSLELPNAAPSAVCLISPTPPPVSPIEAATLGLTVAIVKRDQRDDYDALSFTDTSIHIRGKRPLQLRHLVNVEIGDFGFAATVAACDGKEGHTTAELRPFALDKKGDEKWRRLVASAKAKTQEVNAA